MHSPLDITAVQKVLQDQHFPLLKVRDRNEFTITFCDHLQKNHFRLFARHRHLLNPPLSVGMSSAAKP